MEEVQRRNVPALGVTVAVLAIFIGVSTLMAPAIYAALGVSVPLATTVCYMIQGAASLLLGFLGIRKRPTAFFFIALLYLPQSCTFQTPSSSSTSPARCRSPTAWAWRRATTSASTYSPCSSSAPRPGRSIA